MKPRRTARDPRHAGDPTHSTEDGAGRATAVIDKLYALAMRGNVDAAGLFLDRTLGPISGLPGFTAQVAPALVDPGTRADVTRHAPGTTVPAPPRRLLSVKQVAHELGLSSRTVSTLITKGQISAVRIGRRVLLPLVEVERFVRDHS